MGNDGKGIIIQDIPIYMIPEEIEEIIYINGYVRTVNIHQGHIV
jgi:hypothetical protein